MDDVHAYINIENYDTLRVTYILVYVRTWVLQENKLITNIHGKYPVIFKIKGCGSTPIFSRFNSRKWKNFEGHGEGDAASPTKGCLRLWQRVSRTLLSLAQEFAAHFSHQISWRYDLRNTSLAFVHNNPFAHHANMKKKTTNYILLCAA